jgi:hypothetical protein
MEVAAVELDTPLRPQQMDCYNSMMDVESFAG